jgi:hypothetical protein
MVREKTQQLLMQRMKKPQEQSWPLRLVIWQPYNTVQQLPLKARLHANERQARPRYQRPRAVGCPLESGR